MRAGLRRSINQGDMDTIVTHSRTLSDLEGRRKLGFVPFDQRVRSSNDSSCLSGQCFLRDSHVVLAKQITAFDLAPIATVH